MKYILDWEELDINEFFSDREGDEEDDEDQDSASYNFVAKYMDKEFKFFILHSNFNLGKTILRSIANVDGVERIIPMSRYRAMINFGRLFDIDSVKLTINREINSLLHRKEEKNIKNGVN